MTAGIDRDEILRRFEALLDSALTSEAPPSGIDAEILSSVMAGGEDGADRSTRHCDSYARFRPGQPLAANGFTVAKLNVNII